MKVKTYLWIGLIIFLLSNIAVSFVFNDNLTTSFVSGGSLNFGSDSTMLLTDINIIFMPGEPILPKIISGIRDFSLIASVILSVVVLYEQRSWRHWLYVILLVVIAFVIVVVQLEIVLPGIYDFLRKVKASYTLGVIVTPWLYYYLIILIPIIFITIDLSLQIWKVKEK